MLKRLMEFTWLRLLLCCGLVLVAFVGPTASAEGPEVVYDKATDRLLSVQADMVSLKGLLARIAFLSGVEFLMETSVERPVSITLKDMPLEVGLKKIMKTHNLGYAMIYQKMEGQDQSAEPLLISMRIVPKGMENNSNLSLVPVVDVSGEAVMRSLSRRPLRAGHTPPTIFDYAEGRWQARLNKMPEEKRKQIEEVMKRRQEEQAARMEEVEKRRAEREKKVSERQDRRQAAEEKLKESNPELYELRQQQREEMRQGMTEDLKQ